MCPSLTPGTESMNTLRLHLPWRAGAHQKLASAAALVLLSLVAAAPPVQAQQSEARIWNDMLLDAIRHDLARPTVHARNLYHISVAMWDAWATYDATAKTVLFAEKHPTTGPDVDYYRSEALSYAVYNIIKIRFANSPGAAVMLPQFDALMDTLGYNKLNTNVLGNSPAAIGNRIAATINAYGLTDNSNQQGGYANLYYAPKNDPLIPAFPGNPECTFPSLWQPLSIQFFVDQSGNPIPGGYPAFLSAEWGKVFPFALSPADLNIYPKDAHDWWVYHDPGPPPQLEDPATKFDYQHSHELVLTWSSHLDPADGVMMDASPNAVGGAVLPADITGYDEFYDMLQGGDNGQGYDLNPVTGQPYPVQMVPRGDYTRCLAEFWADGPQSETPPGHWFSIFNHVADDPNLQKRIGGVGPVVNNLEWDVKGYLVLGGALHDCAVSCWGIKGYYDSARPITAIRWMADKGQSSDPLAPSYHPDGLPLIPDFVELVTLENTAPGEKLEHLAGFEGKVAAKAWRGPPYIADPQVDVAGVGWILAENWWPYQRPTFVTPPFAGYTSGHSTYSRAGAVVMTGFTGSKWFPGGLGEFECPQNEHLVFEEGPSQTVFLQWASYFDASDQCSLSRIWGGIHPTMDDIPARKIGEIVGGDALVKAKQLYSPWDLGAGPGLAGINGVPVLVGNGSLQPDSVGSLDLSSARAAAPCVLILALESVPVPFKGGVVTAQPVSISIPLITAPFGTLNVPFVWPAGVPSDVSLWMQYLIADAAAVQGVAMSNAVKLITP
jgi:hypothetical protein